MQLSIRLISHLLTAAMTGVFHTLIFLCFIGCTMLSFVYYSFFLFFNPIFMLTGSTSSSTSSQSGSVSSSNGNWFFLWITCWRTQRLQLWLTINRPSLVSNTSVFLLQREAVPPSLRTARSPVWTSTPADVSSALVRQTQVKFLFQKEFYMVKGKPVIFFGNF